MLVGLIEFKKKEENKKLNTTIGAVQIGVGSNIIQRTVRRGIPLSLGVRLESHTTSRKNAKEILKTGYLDPSKSGTGATQALDAIEDSVFQERALKSKGKTFITGSHPYTGPKLIDRLKSRDMRASYRAGANLTKKDWEINAKYNLLNAQVIAETQENVAKAFAGDTNYSEVYRNKMKEFVKDPDFKSFQKKSKLHSLPFIGNLRGRSLYVGGSDDYFRKNFVQDVDIPWAMMTDQKVPVSGSRFGATRAAIKREGLGNLLKNKKKVASGLALLGAGGAIGGSLVHRGVKKLSAQHRAKISKGVKKAHKKGLFL